MTKYQPKSPVWEFHPIRTILSLQLIAVNHVANQCIYVLGMTLW